jgi:polyisoprenoid-binding protein YceI
MLAMLLLVAWLPPDPPDTFLLQPDSRLWVEGTSTIHDWTCEAGSVDGAVNLTMADMPEVSDVTVTVPVEALDCKKGTMNRKAQKALDADDHPEITFDLNAATVAPATDEGDFVVNATGTLTIAGATQPAEVTAQGYRLDNGQVRFKGSYPMKMTDFGVDPPSAMLGTLKTGDEVVVHFDVVAAPSTLEAASN